MKGMKRPPSGGPDGLRELLLLVARQDSDDADISGLVARADAEELIASLVHHGLISLTQERLRGINAVPVGIVDELGARRLGTQIRRLHLRQANETISAALREIPWLVVKGDVLAQWRGDASRRVSSTTSTSW